MAGREPLWRPWILASGVAGLAGVGLLAGVRALPEPWPSVAVALLLTFLVLFLALIVIDLGFGGSMGTTRWADRAARRFTARFARDRGALWLAWAEREPVLSRALDDLARAAAEGHPAAMREYGRHFLDGGMGTTARAAAVPWLRRAAEAGDAPAAYFLGEILRWGVGEASRPGEALAWYLRAARGGYRPAALWLAQACLGGEGQEADPEQAASWARRAEAMAGEDAPAPGLLAGPPAEEGGGATAGEIMDEVGEALWEMKGYRVLVVVLAALLVGALALVILVVPVLQRLALVLVLGLALVAALMRLLGHHAPGPSRSGKDLEARAGAGDAEASFQLGLRFERGHYDLPRDLELARRHFDCAAQAGHARASLHLADLLSWGMGGPADPDRAHRILEWLARTGHPEASAKLQRLGAGLNSGDGPADQEKEGGSP